MKKFKNLCFIASMLLCLNSYAIELTSVGLDEYPEFLYFDENFDVDWGMTIQGAWGTDEGLSEIEAHLYLSEDAVLDEKDVLISTLKNEFFSPFSGFFSAREYDLVLPSSSGVNFGYRYLIFVADPENKVEGDNVEDNISVHPFYLLSKQVDITHFKLNVGKEKSDKNVVNFEKILLNSGSEFIDSALVTVSLANDSAKLETSPIYQYQTYVKNISTDNRFVRFTHSVDTLGMNINSRSFVAKFDISVPHLTEENILNNSAYVKIDWEELSDLNITSDIILMQDGKSEITTCDAIIYDDGGALNNYSDNLNCELIIKPNKPENKVQLHIEKNFGLWAFDDELKIYEDVNSDEPTKTLWAMHSNSEDFYFESKSEDGSIKIIFKTNSEDNNHGFKINVSCWSPDLCPDDPNKTEPGNCGCGNTEESCLDCMGVPNGEAYLDNCDQCVGGTSETTPCEQDCNNDWGGEAFVDSCGNCAGGNTQVEPVLDKEKCKTSNIEVGEKSIELNITPNPFRESVNITLPRRGDLFVYDLQGKLLESYQNKKSVCFGQNLTEGVYIIKYISGDKTISKRIVKQ